MFDRLKMRLRCLRGIHAPVRTRVRRDGLYYIGHCDACGIAIRKRNGKKWEASKV